MEKLISLPAKDREMIIKEVVDFLSQKDEISAAYIIGSFIKEEDFRDIDLCILVKNGLSKRECIDISLSLGYEIERAITQTSSLGKGVEFDVRILQETPIYFQYEVIKDGRLVFSRKSVADYEADVLSRYLDYKPVLEFFHKKLLENV